MKKKIFITLGIFYLFFMILMFAATSNDEPENKNSNILTIREYGDKYPYTIDNLELKCSPVNAVWVETTSGEKYSLNGNAMNLLKSDSTHKGSTNLILKKDKTDIEILNKGFELCKNK